LQNANCKFILKFPVFHLRYLIHHPQERCLALSIFHKQRSSLYCKDTP